MYRNTNIHIGIRIHKIGTRTHIYTNEHEICILDLDINITKNMHRNTNQLMGIIIHGMINIHIYTHERYTKIIGIKSKQKHKHRQTHTQNKNVHIYTHEHKTNILNIINKHLN